MTKEEAKEWVKEMAELVKFDRCASQDERDATDREAEAVMAVIDAA